MTHPVLPITGFSTEDSILNYEAEAVETGDSPTVFPLGDYALLSVTGEDRAKLLQGQTSCDVEGLQSGQQGWGTANTPKGRCYASFAIVNAGDRLLLRMPAEVAIDSMEALEKYAAFFKVNLELLENWQGVGCSQRPADLPDGGILIQVAPDSTASEIWAEKAALSSWLDSQTNLARATRNGWERLMIEAGIPEVYRATAEEFVPQMLNLQALGAISFTKGCYTGQEIVARMHYLGKLKKRAYVAEVTGFVQPSPGARIVMSGTEQLAGEIVRCVPTTSDRDEGIRWLLIVILPAETAMTAGFEIEGAPGHQLIVSDMPYAIEKGESQTESGE